MVRDYYSSAWLEWKFLRFIVFISIMDHLIDIESSKGGDLGWLASWWVNLLGYWHIFTVLIKELLQVLFTHWLLSWLILCCGLISGWHLISNVFIHWRSWVWLQPLLGSKLLSILNDLANSSSVLRVFLLLWLWLLLLLILLPSFTDQLLESLWVMSLRFKTVLLVLRWISVWALFFIANCIGSWRVLLVVIVIVELHILDQHVLFLQPISRSWLGFLILMLRYVICFWWLSDFCWWNLVFNRFFHSLMPWKEGLRSLLSVIITFRCRDLLLKSFILRCPNAIQSGLPLQLMRLPAVLPLVRGWWSQVWRSWIIGILGCCTSCLWKASVGYYLLLLIFIFIKIWSQALICFISCTSRNVANCKLFREIHFLHWLNLVLSLPVRTWSMVVSCRHLVSWLIAEVYW